MVIVKIGGSLFDSPNLKDWLGKLAAIEDKRVVLVPGGGPFADQVRAAAERWDISEIAAHHMAVMAMQQYAYLLSSLNSNIEMLHSYKEILNVGSNSCLMVWMPYYDVVNLCDYPKNWSTTSDSLALWLASKLSAHHLNIVKCADIQNKKTQQIINSEIVDGYFLHAAKYYGGEIRFYHSSQSDKCISDINND